MKNVNELQVPQRSKSRSEYANYKIPLETLPELPQPISSNSITASLHVREIESKVTKVLMILKFKVDFNFINVLMLHLVSRLIYGISS